MSPFPLSLSWHLPGLLTVQKAHSLHVPAHLGRPPQAGPGAAPEAIWPTPSPAPPASCQDQLPGQWGGAGGTLTSGDVISALGERGSTLWMRPSLLGGGRGGGGRLLPLSLGDEGHLGRNQDGVNQTLMFKATTPRG